ncbi:MAG: 16S rRNA (cytidine(1402)-2'-O)-methyltransferase [Crocinitomicaceae bacterium]|jgi:16S rRNA (cytidine1402-2'-O)-methyltransferase|nr:16S rRNA (cytidine(1402)-2'-O)-methyltransferase [Crocinitomicaceae bacterium]
MAKLVLVPTPIGNLEDITLRSLRTLKECDYILAEDTRVTNRLLAHFEIKKPIAPFHAHNEHRALENVLMKIKANDVTVLVSDAGTPGISDPGFLLARACVENDIELECLPGPTAFVPALVGSGIACDRFVFEGFLPHKKGRQTKWLGFQEEERTIVLYESPHRINKCLSEIMEYLGEDRNVCVVREISKMFETFHRGTAAELLAFFEQTPAKGEIVVVIEGKNKKNEKRSSRTSKE